MVLQEVDEQFRVMGLALNWTGMNYEAQNHRVRTKLSNSVVRPDWRGTQSRTQGESP